MPGTLPDDRSLASIRRYYRRTIPLFDAYCKAIETHNVSDRPITEPMPTAGTVSNTGAARIALEHLGRPADDLSITMATAYLERIEEEIRLLSTEKPTFDDVVLGHFFNWAGCVPAPHEWLAQSADDQVDDADEIAAKLDDEQFAQAVRDAIPVALERIIARDAKGRKAAGGAS
ncbi:hypothetical protein [Saccharomonospora cyanea]|uniref:Uncharacterized protein n=1 Tax=Saccharomonospora cyanea NA-134 TaxID=882082 RepID=H5XG67_9PSEU|nr:hypothetical protein [Saccharomonospora cyanea]EHR62649.1 hypothetical protein SaccyDRAFT_3822 [Saccharomonospora cyanea NA-134]